MKKAILCWFWLIYFQPSFSQNQDFTKVYHPLINQAELNITDSAYSQALHHYQIAFSQVNQGFARDYWNAMVCAIATKKWILTQEFSLKLADKGMEIDFEKNPFFDSFKENADWQVFENQYNTRLSEAKEKIRYDLRNQLAEITTKDQEVRKNDDTFLKYGRQVDEDNIQEIIDLSAKYGFPNEELIGLDPEYPINFNTNLPFNMVLFHYFKTKALDGFAVEKLEIAQVMKKAIKDGQLEPLFYTYYVDFPFLGAWQPKKFKSQTYGTDALYWYPLKGEEYEWAYPVRADTLETVINKRRKSFGLENLKDYRRKVFFDAQNQNKLPFIFYYENINPAFVVIQPKEQADVIHPKFASMQKSLEKPKPIEIDTIRPDTAKQDRENKADEGKGMKRKK